MYKLYKKLKILRVELKKLHKGFFYQISEQVQSTRNLLLELQSNLQNDPWNVDLQDEERVVSAHLQKLLGWEENILRQKARCS